MTIFKKVNFKSAYTNNEINWKESRNLFVIFRGATHSIIDDLFICPPNIILDLFRLLDIPYPCSFSMKLLIGPEMVLGYSIIINKPGYGFRLFFCPSMNQYIPLWIEGPLDGRGAAAINNTKENVVWLTVLEARDEASITLIE